MKKYNKLILCNFIFLFSFSILPAYAQAREKDETLCLLVVDYRSGQTLKEEGRCDEQYTPASTFKIPLAVMGFDSGFLKNVHEPILDYKQGEPDWGGKNWTGKVDPTQWMIYSVVWYSQRISHALGEKSLHDYAVKFGYGNADLSGDKGKNNGLERAWIISSLKISPREQVIFLRTLLEEKLPVSQKAQSDALALVQKGGDVNGWVYYGKTGMAYPRNPDETFDYAHPYGWYVGWAEKEGKKIVFSVLRQDPFKMEGSASQRARMTLEKTLSALVPN